MGAAENLQQPPPDQIGKPKSVSLSLLAGIFFVPYIFSWFTLRPGYSSTSRSISFIWMFFLVYTIHFAPSHNTTPSGNLAAQVSMPASKIKKPIDQKLLKGLQKSTDKMEGISWYKVPGYDSNISAPSHIALYLGQKDGVYVLRFFANYRAEDWLFVKSYKFLVDGKRFELSGSIETKVGEAGFVHEWSDSAMDAEIESIVRAIAVSKDATIRYEGRQFYKDRKISKGEKDALKKMLAVWDSQY